MRRQGGLHRLVTPVVALLRGGRAVLLAQHWNQVHRVPDEPRVCARSHIMIPAARVTVVFSAIECRQQVPNIWVTNLYLLLSLWI